MHASDKGPLPSGEASEAMVGLRMRCLELPELVEKGDKGGLKGIKVE